MKKLAVFIIMAISILGSAYPEISVRDSSSPNVIITHPAAAANYSIVNVNSSQYWDNLNSPSDINHNDLANKQGGQTGEYYHLNLSIYNYLLSNIYSFIKNTDGYITSLIGNQTYRKLSDTLNAANISNPLWVNKTGDIMTGNLTINIQAYFKGNISSAISQKQCWANLTDECAICSYSNGTAKIEESPCNI